MMDEPAFVERILELDGGALAIRFYAPTKEPLGEFKCRYVIGWPKGQRRSYASGLDAMQALLLAMRTVHTDLVESDAYKAGRLTWCDQPDLDLPPPWAWDAADTDS